MNSTFTFSYSPLWLINLMATAGGYKKISPVCLCSLNHQISFFLRERQSNHKKKIKYKNKEYGNKSWQQSKGSNNEVQLAFMKLLLGSMKKSTSMVPRRY